MALLRPGTLWLGWLGLAAAFAMGTHAQANTSLYAPDAGTPAAQGWATLSLGAPGVAALANGVYSLDSRGAGVDTFGHARLSPVPLDAAQGWQADWRLRVLDEQHSTGQRAGFSLLFVGSDAARSVEIAFHEDRVFAYAYRDGAFVQGVGAAVDTGAWHDYSLQVGGDRFSLLRDGSLLFDGWMQDYRPQGLPYTVGGFLFFGDNTSSASAHVELAGLSLGSPVPEPEVAWLLISGLLGLAAVVGRRPHPPCRDGLPDRRMTEALPAA